MTAPIGLQLYSLREAFAEDFDGTIRQVAEIGYVGIEPWGGLMTDIAAKKKVYDDLGLTVPSVHYQLPVGEHKNKVLDDVAQLGCQHVILPFINPELFTSEDGLKTVADILNEANEVGQANGLTIHYHNHDFEYGDLNGRPAIYSLMEKVDPAVKFELDTYWIKVAGVDPAKVVAEMGGRSPLLHIKDGPAHNRQDDMTALGTGAMDIPALITAGGAHTQWVFVELDRCATDMMTAVRESYAYMTSNGLAQGR
ncbi:MAG: sugar phosphate isomerase/epimerase [Ardenticatenaceae bacterium]|nr:sugar phosphate isomerase/epimerase [Ardenticatenaceae bacterium]